MKIGTNDVNKIMLGSSEVEKIYLGTEQVYGDSTATPKWVATYVGGTTASAECDSTSAITENEITLENLTDVVIGDCVTTIGMSVFEDCSSLTSVTIGNNVTSIGESAFYVCSSLTSVDIPNSVTSIGENAFGTCGSLTSVTIGSGVTSIEQNAFRSCTGLTSVTIYATTPPTLGGTSAFYRTNDCPIYVPSGSVETYKEDDGWYRFESRIEAIQ